MNKNALLSFMIGCYLLPILMVCYQYQSNPSVSNIICDETCKDSILFFMGLMGGEHYYTNGNEMIDFLKYVFVSC